MSLPSYSLPRETAHPMAVRYRKDSLALLALVLLAATLFFTGLGATGLFDADEPAYAQAAREMWERGDWVTPHFNGKPRFDKPILFYWLILGSYRAFGVTEFAVRCWSALAGIGLVLLLWRAARRRFGTEAALCTGIAFCTNLLAAVLARAAVTDMLLTFFTSAAILAGLDALEESGVRGRWHARIMWVAMALAVLVKGPVGVVIPVMALGGCLLVLSEVRAGLRRLVPWEGPILFLAVALPWYALALAANGWSFIEGFVIKHHVTRYTGVVSSHAGPLWFYIPVVLAGFFPWSAYLPPALWRAVQTARARLAEGGGDRLAVTCLCWLTGVFAFFSLAGTKLPSYLFPAFPAMALLVGDTIVRTFPASSDRPLSGLRDRRQGAERGEQSDKSPAPCASERAVPPWMAAMTPWLIGVIGGAAVVGLVLFPMYFDRLRPAARGVLDEVAAPTGLSWALAGLILLGTLAYFLTRGRWRPGFMAAAASGVILVGAWGGAPTAHAILQGSLREFSEVAREVLRPGDLVVVYGLNAPSVVFYAHRRVAFIGDGAAGELEAALRPLLDAGRPVVLITRSALSSRLEAVPGLALRKRAGGYALYVSSR
jgi:4-amino-4-deoxy-L-arabinose transferase-like glycosyltransferase